MPSKRDNIFFPAYVIGLLLIQAFLVAEYSTNNLMDVASVALHLVGMYGVIVGLVLRWRFRTLTDAVTSAHPAYFVTGNTALLVVMVSIMSHISKKGLNEPARYRPIRFCFSIFIMVLFLVYFIFHMLIVVPLAWIVYFFANVLIDLVLTSGLNQQYRLKKNLEMERMEAILQEDLDVEASNRKSEIVSIRDVFIQNRGQEATSFLVGIPSILIGVILKLVSVF
ncbi:hypothetical protein ACFLU1_03960 [Chloroflexota bacterium]